jgi:hypothetical protein
MKKKMMSVNNELYWVGSYKVLIHNSLEWCVDEDGYNKLYKDGSHTEGDTFDPTSEEEWKEIYAKKIGDLWFDKRYIPKDINVETKENTFDPTSEEERKEIYAKKIGDLWFDKRYIPKDINVKETKEKPFLLHLQELSEKAKTEKVRNIDYIKKQLEKAASEGLNKYEFNDNYQDLNFIKESLEKEGFKCTLYFNYDNYEGDSKFLIVEW